MKQSYLSIANSVGPKPKWEDGKADLAAQKGWLLIIDNADDPSMDIGGKYIPGGKYGAVLVTTINTEIGTVIAKGGHAKFHSLKDLSIEEGVQLLLSEANADTKDEELGALGEAIVEELQRFPLAIVLAGAVVRKGHYSLDEYLEELRSNPRALLSPPGPVPDGTDYDHNVYAAWEITLKTIRARHPVEADVSLALLDVLASLHHEDVPDSVLKQVDLQSSQSLFRRFGTALARGMRVTQQTFWPQHESDRSVAPQPFLDEKAVRTGLSVLSSYLVIDRDQSKKSVYIHKLVHSWLRHRMDTMRQEQMASQACEALHRSIPDGSKSTGYNMRTRLYTHIRSLVDTTQGLGKLKTATLREFALVAQESGDFVFAQNLYEAALSRLTELSGSGSPETLASKAGLAMALQEQGQYSAARAANEEILQSLRQYKGDSETTYLKAYVTNNLASILQRDKHYEQAAVLAGEALAIRKKCLTIDHWETLESMTTLALIKETQEKWIEAQEMTEEVLQRREKLLGKMHRDTLASQARLGGILSRRSQYADAEKILRRVEESRRCVLGEEHPDTLISLTRLAEVQIERGEYDPAEKNLRSALTGCKRQLVSDHPDLLIVEGNLAVCLRHQGMQHDQKYLEAESIYRSVLRGYEHRQESHLPEALKTKVNLAVVLRDQKKLEDSERVGREAIEAWERSRGPDDPGTLRSKDSLGWTICKISGRLSEAEELITTAADGLEMALGLENRDTLEAVAHLAHVLRRQKKYVEACVQFSKVCEGFEKIGVQHWCFEHFSTMRESMRKKGIREPPSVSTSESSGSDVSAVISASRENTLGQEWQEGRGIKRPLPPDDVGNELS